MDDFLKNDALSQQEEKLNVTYLAMYNGQIIGFFSLLSDIIKLKDIENEYDLPYRTCPAIKIGRLAVNERYSSLGFGTIIKLPTTRSESLLNPFIFFMLSLVVPVLFATISIVSPYST